MLQPLTETPSMYLKLSRKSPNRRTDLHSLQFSDDRMMQFTCLNCQVVFKTRDLHRDHYKSDWHRYNLKRKIADLPPVSAEEFQQRVNFVQQENASKAQGKTYTYCTVCKKSFASKQSFENHLQSKRHIDLQNVRKIDSIDNIAQPSVKNNKCDIKLERIAQPLVENKSDIELESLDDLDIESLETASSGTEEIDSDEWEDVVSENNPILSNDCLFCSHHSASLTKNIKHMSVTHSFFIPFIEYVTDVKGLLIYLGEKICQGYMCIWCSDKINSFSSLNAVRSHMIDKGHAKIPYDTEGSLEYADFYDFELEFEDDESTNGDSSSLDYNLSAVKTGAPDEDDATMVLPSGDVICHRSLVKYIR